MKEQAEKLRAAILELCSEDYYGFWEFGWVIYPTSFDAKFVSIVSRLVKEKAIAPYTRWNDIYTESALDEGKLARDMAHYRSTGELPDSPYHFTIPNHK
jgi:hypothetical protein